MKISILCLLCLVVNSVAATDNFRGPFKAEAIAFYFIHDGGPLKIRVNFSSDRRKAGKAVSRFFNAEEELVKWDYLKIPAGKTKEVTYDFGKSAPKGIYQFRYSGKNILVSPVAEPDKKFGFLAMRCGLYSTVSKQFNKAFFYIVPKAEYFTIRSSGAKGEIFDADSKKTASISRSRQKIAVKGKGGQIWSLSLKMKAGSREQFYAGAMPLILCPDADTAKKIAGSTERSSDGRYFPHKFQIKMYAWLKSLKKDDLQIKAVDMRTKRAALEADKYAGALFGRWALLQYLPYTLRYQNIDPASPDFGSGGSPAALAAVYSIKRDWNPYYNNEIIKKRMLTAQFKWLLRLHENDTDSDVDHNYSGSDALRFMKFPAYSFLLAGNKLKDKKLADLWKGALRRIPDRFSMYRVSCENQSSHWLMAYASIAVGGDENAYFELAKDYAAGMSLPGKNPFMKTGYQQEAYGPDATYQGLGVAMQALYYRVSGDENIKRSLDTIFKFFNHTVAPEPGRKNVFGASNFCHRTKGSWVKTQHLAGRYYMRGILPSFDVWMKFMRQRPPLKERLETGLRKAIRIPSKRNRNYETVSNYSAGVSGPLFYDYLYPSLNEVNKQARFPVEESDNFTRNFNNEFLAIRRPAYYILVYTGKSRGKRMRRYVNFKVANSRGNYLQGVSMFWTPEFGNFILSMNWNADTLQMLRAEISDKECDFPDYWSFKRNYNKSDGILNLSWKMHKLPLQVKRKIIFKQSSVKIELELIPEKSFKTLSLVEQLPFLKKEGLKINFKNADGKWQETPCRSKEIIFTNAAGAGIKISLTKAVDFSFGGEYTGLLKRDQNMTVLKIKLPNTFQKNVSYKLEYELIPVKKGKIK